MIAARSFFAVVAGDHVTQDPRWLAGLPEWVNWDASVYVRIPDAGASVIDGLPRATVLSAHAGNRHGPDFDARWAQRGWTTRALARDPRLAKLPRTGQWTDDASIAFASGELLVVRFDAGVEAFEVKPGAAKPVRTTVPMDQHGYRHILAGNTPADVYLCEGSQGIYHYDGKAWSKLDADGLDPLSCAVAGDGALWVVAEGGPGAPGRVARRQGSAWSDVPLPDGANATRIVVAGTRAFALGSTDKPQRTRVYSTEPVAQVVDIDESDLPGPLWIDGITGLDVTSVDTLSASADPAGPGTRACTSLVAWLGPGPADTVRTALGASPPPLVEVAGMAAGTIAAVAPGSAQMRVQPSHRKRSGVAALPASFDEGVAVVNAARSAMPGAGARLLCAMPRVVRRFPTRHPVSRVRTR